MDLSHVEIAHHGTIGNRYDESTPFDTTVTKKATKNGFEMTLRGKGGEFQSIDKFAAPGVFSIHNPRECITVCM